MKKTIMMLSVFVLMTVSGVQAQAYQQVYNRLNQICHIHLGRGNMPDLNVWAHQIVTGQINMDEVTYRIVNSDEAKARAAELASGTANAAGENVANPFVFVPRFWGRALIPGPRFVFLVQFLNFQSLVNLKRVDMAETTDWAKQILQGKAKLEDIILAIQNGGKTDTTNDNEDSGEEARNSAESSDSVEAGSEDSPVDGLGA